MLRHLAAFALFVLAAPAPAAAEGPSLYDLEAPLVDQEDRAIGLDVHEGRPVLVSMFYAKCPHACPALIADIRRIDAALAEEARAKVRYLLVSLDPTDRTTTFRELIEMHSLDPARWRLARTDEGTVRKVAAALGIRYRQLPDGSWNHSSIVTVLDAKGRVLHSAEGLALPHEDTISALTKAAAEH